MAPHDLPRLEGEENPFILMSQLTREDHKELKKRIEELEKRVKALENK